MDEGVVAKDSPPMSDSHVYNFDFAKLSCGRCPIRQPEGKCDPSNNNALKVRLSTIGTDEPDFKLPFNMI